MKNFYKRLQKVFVSSKLQNCCYDRVRIDTRQLLPLSPRAVFISLKSGCVSLILLYTFFL